MSYIKREDGKVFIIIVTFTQCCQQTETDLRNHSGDVLSDKYDDDLVFKKQHEVKMPRRKKNLL